MAGTHGANFPRELTKLRQRRGARAHQRGRRGPSGRGPLHEGAQGGGGPGQAPSGRFLRQAFAFSCAELEGCGHQRRIFAPVRHAFYCVGVPPVRFGVTYCLVCTWRDVGGFSCVVGSTCEWLFLCGCSIGGPIR